jgi:hypothetical protein
VPWGAHPMTEGYRSRFSYLYHIFYQQKLGFHKLPAALIAIPFALISKLLYDGMPVIPTYSDIRIRKTMEISKKHLNLGHPILVFPEDSNNGYEDIIQFYNSGFVYLALDYFKDTQIDLPIYPVYCNSKNNTMLIEKPLSIQDYVKMGFRRDQIAEAIKNKVNQMAHELNQRKSI